MTLSFKIIWSEQEQKNFSLIQQSECTLNSNIWNQRRTSISACYIFTIMFTDCKNNRFEVKFINNVEHEYVSAALSSLLRYYLRPNFLSWLYKNNCRHCYTYYGSDLHCILTLRNYVWIHFYHYTCKMLEWINMYKVWFCARLSILINKMKV